MKDLDSSTEEFGLDATGHRVYRRFLGVESVMNTASVCETDEAGHSLGES